MDTDDRGPAAGKDEHWEHDQRQHTRPVVSQRTFWIRRTVALLILIAFIILVVLGVKAIAKIFSSDESDAKAPAGAEQTEPNGDPAPETKAPDEGTEPAGGPADCEPASLDMSVAAATTQFPVGQTNQFSVVTKYTGEAQCTLDVGLSARPLTVFSGEDRIWSSADCDEAGARVLLLDKDAQDTSAVEWDMHRSESTCTPDQALAKPGTYRAVLSLDGNDSEPFVFNVVE